MRADNQQMVKPDGRVYLVKLAIKSASDGQPMPIYFYPYWQIKGHEKILSLQTSVEVKGVKIMRGGAPAMLASEIIILHGKLEK
jgi:hypothetical protein